MRLHAISSLLPAALLAMGCLLGGVWSWLGLAAMTALVYGMDRVLFPRRADTGNGRMLVWTITAAHFCLLALAMAHFSVRMEDMGNAIVLWFGLGLWFGQVANSNAHEMIHNSDRPARRAGMAVFASLLNGHHVSAHLKVHHVHAATDLDPNSARVGESIYQFFLRAMSGEFRAGLKAENAFMTNRKRGGLHPYVIYGAVSLTSLASAWLMGGIWGCVALVTLSLYAQLQLLMSDYVQHYGLRRNVTDGRLEAVGLQHSWNAPQAYSGAMMLNAPRHSDHHTNPAKPFTALEIDPDEMPVLPRSLPVMATVALVPPLWRRMMDKRAARWSTQLRETAPKTASSAGAKDPVLSS